jgi:hypothetical protein
VFPYVIRLAWNRKVKPNANTRTLRPDKCLVVKSLDSNLRPVCPSQYGIHRHHHQGNENMLGMPPLGCYFDFPLSRTGKESDGAFTRSPPPREAAIFF